MANTAKDDDYKHKKTECQTDDLRDLVYLILVGGKDWQYSRW